jgi:hypothetical protein
MKVLLDNVRCEVLEYNVKSDFLKIKSSNLVIEGNIRYEYH